MKEKKLKGEVAERELQGREFKERKRNTEGRRDGTPFGEVPL